MAPSTTTTLVAETRTASTILTDYALHHTGDESQTRESASAAAGFHPRNTPVWDTVHRRVPEYRPTNTTRDQSQVRVYQNGVERAFITVMFTGLFINAGATKIMRAVFGDKLGNYPIGGEI